jgi:hypothetical protein
MKTTNQKQTKSVSETSFQSQPMFEACCSPTCCGTNNASKTTAEK